VDLDLDALDREWRAWLLAADAEIGDSEMARPFPVLGILIAREADAPPGVGVFQVCPGGPAARAGLRDGDRILAIDGVAVETKSDLLAALQAGAYGRSAPVGVERGGARLELAVPMDRYIDG
jgi:S1-C subfamily serine protease